MAALLPADDCSRVLILNGDVPGTSRETLGRMAELFDRRGLDIVFLGFKPPDPTGYGRVIYDDSGMVLEIREEKELSAQDRDIDLVNAGIYLARADRLAAFIKEVRPSPNQKEFLLTDVVSYVVRNGGRADVVIVKDPGEVEGVNTRLELASVTRRIRQQRNRALMLAGVSMPFPDCVEVEFGFEVGADTILSTNVALRGRGRVGKACAIGNGVVVEDCEIGDQVTVLPYCVLESSVIKDGCKVGPFAHTRPGTVLERGVHLGNFVETKKTVLGAGSKANHLTYLGDADVGEGVNVGAGTITCNYDGYNKFKTVIKDRVFIGSDTQLVAPVTVGEDAVIGAGTTVTRDVPPGALALSRVEQANREGYAAQRKERLARKKSAPRP
jgi:bifunctional UDP-N-acetylglucosamine pyrophosphorylase/glucosamine-1-phosphate N-acetyltransferase